MTNTYRLKKLARDLMLGDLFVAWKSELEAGTHFNQINGQPKRVLDFKGPAKSRKGMVQIHLDDGSVIQLHPEMIVFVEVLA